VCSMASVWFPMTSASGAPDILVKGVFDREYETIEEKKDKHGNVTSVVQAQRPRLVVTVLDLKTRQIREVQSSTTITGTVETEHMTTGDLLTLYGRSLLRRCSSPTARFSMTRQTCRVISPFPTSPDPCSEPKSTQPELSSASLGDPMFPGRSGKDLLPFSSERSG
jgi:hypothetical protein